MAWNYQLLCARSLLALRLGRLIESSAFQSTWVEHRSTGLCLSAVRPSVHPSAHANPPVKVRETVLSLSPHVKHAQSLANSYSKTRVLLFALAHVSNILFHANVQFCNIMWCVHVCISKCGLYSAREESTLINGSHRFGLTSHYGRYLTPSVSLVRVKLLGLWTLGGKVLAKYPSTTRGP